MSNTPAGWYPDANGQIRWWDGNQWTEQVQPSSAPPGQPPAQQQPQSGAQQQWGDTAAGPAYGQQQYGQQQYGQQQYGQPGPYGQASEQPKSKTPLIIAGVVAAVLLIGGGITTAILVSGDDDKDDKNSSQVKDDPSNEASEDVSDEPSDDPSEDPSDEPVTLAGDPEDTVSGYIDAAMAIDCPGMQAHLTGALKNQLNCDGAQAPEDFEFEADYRIEGSEVNGSSATVDTWEAYALAGEEMEEANCTYSLVDEDGSWLIENVTCQDL
ncbi:DUF2510 domain-containing protein [Nocardioides sp. AE5]|uniref:DUF2510 domain-containing protein n=1 Tax=Nocardioides sp. AE5 TaxID=2962573 RepID=UPI0028826D43|nr:DUF2510 domain-containing protein [Nocardioides sp. AE5]MDT0203414.1 DUF2510 domain-containing protein [Nocardioides sp. AE5]